MGYSNASTSTWRVCPCDSFSFQAVSVRMIRSPLARLQYLHCLVTLAQSRSTYALLCKKSLGYVFMFGFTAKELTDHNCHRFDFIGTSSNFGASQTPGTAQTLYIPLDSS